MSTASVRIQLCMRVTCPHCWHGFPPEEVLWISQHPDLRDDPKVEIAPGQKDLRRFLPTRFNVDGEALDARGFPCHKLACPNCHLPIPRAMLEMEPLFMSVLGSPGSGKSFFTTAMTWQLRQNLAPHFGLSFSDADAETNGPLIENENLLFHTNDRNLPVTIEKTQVRDERTTTSVLMNGQSVTLPRPFLFSLRPEESHPNFSQAARTARTVCMYDNAGENFHRGVDAATSPVIRHLVQAKLLFFIFDPTKDPRFRAACQGKTSDPQMQDDAKIERQDSILAVAADCIRQHKHLPAHERYDRPLIVVVNKYDAWASLLGNFKLTFEMLLKQGSSPTAALKLDVVHEVSVAVRKILVKYSPEIVNAAEGFARQVIYIPCSPLGGSPEVDASSGLLKRRPKDIKPMWTEVPFLYAVSRWVPGLIPYYLRPKEAEGSRIVKMANQGSPSGIGASQSGIGSDKKPKGDDPRIIKLRSDAPPSDDASDDTPRVWGEAGA